MLAAHLLAALAVLQGAAATARPDTAASVSSAATARVSFALDSTPTPAVVVRGFELQIANAGPAAPATGSAAAAPTTGAAQVRFVRTPDAITGALAARGASGQRIPSVTVDVLDGSGRVVMTLRLADVLVASDHVVLTDRSALEQQRLALLDASAQLNSDLQEAERQQTLTEALDKKRLSSSLEVARVHSQVELLRKRAANQSTRLAMLDAQLAAMGPVEEQVTLTFGKFEIDQPGAAPSGYSFENAIPARKSPPPR